ncbi:hypothetical protein OH76DRAFT_1488414 [Lentinus brumalis]|uniref:Uncharacterized protein n=1 Tax=Lentinus brumalis TaxID=2498619 RepID=A0A371CQY9_9APHY|nr:hypothetical protein OH76DRAFT_1488414 [Polyporus brumalis]
MGRTGKYRSETERKTARREQKARYAQSPRGQAAQAAARVRYVQKKSNAATTLESITIPDALRAYASSPFVMSFAFREVTGPGLGLRRPPYTFRMPDRRSLDSLERRGSRDSLVVKLETLQFSWAVAAGAQRRVQWAGKGVDEIMKAGVQELDARVRAWGGMGRRIAQLGPGDAAVLDVAMRWGARQAMILADELEIRRRGEEAWVEASRRGGLPLQKLVTENRQRIEDLPTDDDESDEDV